MTRVLRHLYKAIFLIIGCVFGVVGGVAAQDGLTVTEVEFWSLMNQTNAALQNPASGGGELTRLQDAWEAVARVRLDDGTELPIEMGWLIDGLGVSDENMLQQARERVQALLDFRATQVQVAASSDSLNTLDKVLQDSRFQYPDEPELIPTQPPPDDLNLPDLPQPSAGLSQFVLIIGGLVVVGLVAVYIARGLRIQGAAVKETSELGDDPETSVDATTLAANSETARDYRSAVRYLYLSSLLLLDERGLIHYDRTLTNREHLGQIADKPQLLELLRPVVNTFDRVWYGFAPLSEALYQDYRRDVERLRELAR
jgi:hypothetical protein